MKTTDVISKYLEAIKLGKSQEEAEFFATSWAECMEIHPNAATKRDLEIAVERINGSIGKLSTIVTTIGVAILIEIFRRWYSGI